MAVATPESKIGLGTLLVGKYRVEREIGRGGMAAVYEAEHIALGKRVAVKVLAAELSNSAIVIERFFREARAAASVKSPYIVEVYDSGRLEDGRPFIAMEYLDGESLYDRMARVRLIDPQTTVRVISQCCKGLMKAHALGIVHRDLKPENIHLTKSEDGEEVAKILDFGLAKFYAPVRTDEKTARLTREGAVFGTPAYMSPEQVKGQGSVDHRADLWALGCMAFECLTGRPVWNTDQGVAMTFAAIAAATPPVPSKLRPDLPPAFDAWFKKALERDVNKRFQTAKELAEALARAFNTPSISLVNVAELGELEKVAATLEELPSESVQLMESERPPPARLAAAAAAAPRIETGSATNIMAAPSADATVPMSVRGAVSSGERAMSPRDVALSATDLPPTAGPDSPVSTRLSPRSPGPGRFVATGALLAAAVVAGYFAWTKLLRPQVFTPVVASSASAPPASAASAADSAMPTPVQSAIADAPPWMATIEEGQRLLWTGDTDGALAKFAEAKKQGGSTLAQTFIDHVTVAKASTGPCKLVAFSHPRYGTGSSVGRTAVAAGPKGAVAIWTDNHETSTQTHAYAVLLDQAGRPTSKPFDLTPEGENVWRPSPMSVDDKIALLYWDKGSQQAGVRVRMLDGDGRIAGGSQLVSGQVVGELWPAMDRAPDGTFWVAWEEDPEKEGMDLFLRHLGPDLAPVAPELRLTDYVLPEKAKVAPQVDVPTVAIGGQTLFVAYSLDREHEKTVVRRMRIPLGDPALLGSGLEDHGTAPVPGGEKPVKHDRELVDDVTTVNDDKTIGVDYPAMACGTDGCFLAWHEQRGGAQIARIDPTKGIVIWRKRVSTSGGHPALAESADGRVQIIYYDQGKVRTAAVSRDGVGTTTTFARVSGEQPRPWISAGRLRGEWYVAWQDNESGHSEAYVARLACKD
jgi:serine/threonine-protein kinase